MDNVTPSTPAVVPPTSPPIVAPSASAPPSVAPKASLAGPTASPAAPKPPAPAVTPTMSAPPAPPKPAIPPPPVPPRVVAPPSPPPVRPPVLSPPIKPAMPVTAPAAQSAQTKKEPEIVVMPEKFYGAALKMTAPPIAQQAAPSPPPKPAPKPVSPPGPVVAPIPKHTALPIILVVIGLVLVVGGVFVYLNRGLLFKKPALAPAPTPVVVALPSAPANLTALVSGGAVALSWVDAATNESAYRLERKENNGTFLPLTTLPANSASFLDVSTEAGKTYVYQVVAANASGDSSPSNEANATLAAAAPPPPTVPSLPPAGLDSDSDGLTDVEETTVFGTDPYSPDTDHDGFLDGNEAFNLYNPGAKAPVRLIDSGLVTNFSAPAGWAIYIPVKWTGKLNVADGSSAVIDSGHGETFEISLEDNSQHLPLMDWYLARNPGILSSAVRSIVTKGELEGVLSQDRTTAYFAWDGKIFALHYNVDGQSYEYFRTTYEMMLNSLKLVGAPVVAAPVLPPTAGPGSLVGEGSTSTAETAPTSSQP